jgi:uncharacterized protein (DUF2062 family)
VLAKRAGVIYKLEYPVKFPKHFIIGVVLMRSRIKNRVLETATVLLRQGVVPEKIALGVAWGFVLGTFPVLGVTTFLSAAAAVALRLNHAAVQVANWLAFPLQLSLIVPFFVVGGLLFGTPTTPQDAAIVVELFRADLFNALGCAAKMTLFAVLVWTAAAPPTIYLLYKTFLSLLSGLPETKA